MTDDERRKLFEAIRVQRYRMGWNDAVTGRHDPALRHDLSYHAGRRDAASVARRPR